MFQRHHRVLALAVAVPLVLAACGDDDEENTTPATNPPASTAAASATNAAASTPQEEGFPVTVSASNGEVTIEARPERIVSLSASLTESLYGVGAGDQVVAVDQLSNYPPDAPVTDLDGYSPNIEAIVAHEPDLVVVSDDLGDVVGGLQAVGVPVLLLEAPADLDAAYAQLEVIGAATGHVGDAAELVAQMQADIDEIVARRPTPEPLRYYHELDNTYFSVTSDSFIGSLYSRLGLTNIADAAPGVADSAGYPQLSAEFIVDANPDVIFLADAAFGESLETVSARPGWDSMNAVQTGAVFPLDEDLASRWGPRLVDFLDSVEKHIHSLQLVD